MRSSTSRRYRRAAQLSEQEVREVNFIVKSRAFRYIAGADEKWLYPERHVSKTDWHDFGCGYLLMPDPRGLTLGGDIIIGHRGGGASHFDAYGRRPWQPDFGREGQELTERRSFYRFQGEFARLFGPYRRGRGFNFGRHDDARDSDDSTSIISVSKRAASGSRKHESAHRTVKTERDADRYVTSSRLPPIQRRLAQLEESARRRGKPILPDSRR